MSIYMHIYIYIYILNMIKIEKHVGLSAFALVGVVLSGFRATDFCRDWGPKKAL